MTLKCGVCKEMFNANNKIPKVLPCGHTFCMACLENTFKTTPSPCLVCQKVPFFFGGPTGLPTNHLALQLVAEELGIKDKIEDQVDQCATHKENCRFVCKPCNVKLCDRCVVEKLHANHEKDTINSLMAIYSKELANCEKEVHAMVDKIEKGVYADVKSRAVEKKKEDLRKAQKRAFQAHDEIDKWLKNVEKQIESVHDKFQRELKEEEAVIIRHLNESSTLAKSIRNKLEKRMVGDAQTDMQLLQVQLKKMHKTFLGDDCEVGELKDVMKIELGSYEAKEGITRDAPIAAPLPGKLFTPASGSPTSFDIPFRASCVILDIKDDAVLLSDNRKLMIYTHDTETNAFAKVTETKMPGRDEVLNENEYTRTCPVIPRAYVLQGFKIVVGFNYYGAGYLKPVTKFKVVNTQGQPSSSCWTTVQATGSGSTWLGTLYPDTLVFIEGHNLSFKRDRKYLQEFKYFANTQKKPWSKEVVFCENPDTNYVAVHDNYVLDVYDDKGAHVAYTQTDMYSAQNVKVKVLMTCSRDYITLLNTAIRSLTIVLHDWQGQVLKRLTKDSSLPGPLTTVACVHGCGRYGSGLAVEAWDSIQQNDEAALNSINKLVFVPWFYLA